MKSETFGNFFICFSLFYLNYYPFVIFFLFLSIILFWLSRHSFLLSFIFSFYFVILLWLIISLSSLCSITPFLLFLCALSLYSIFPFLTFLIHHSYFPYILFFIPLFSFPTIFVSFLFSLFFIRLLFWFLLLFHLSFFMSFSLFILCSLHSPFHPHFCLLFLYDSYLYTTKILGLPALKNLYVTATPDIKEVLR